MIKNFFKPKLWKPIMFENSRVPVLLTKVSPIKVWAVSFFIFVWCRGEMSERTKRHETIHFQQQLELLFAGQWVLYGLSWLKNRLTMNGKDAYYNNVFEKEAYDNDSKENYLETRPRYNWINYV